MPIEECVKIDVSVVIGWTDNVSIVDVMTSELSSKIELESVVSLVNIVDDEGLAYVPSNELCVVAIVALENSSNEEEDTDSVE